MPPKGSKMVECPDCPNGTGVISVGDVDTPCETCDGTGKVLKVPITKVIKHGNQK